MGLWFCMRTAPTPRPLASVSRVKGWLKSGKANTGAEVMAFFKLPKAWSASGVHLKLSFLRSSVRGVAEIPDSSMTEKSLVHYRGQRASPRTQSDHGGRPWGSSNTSLYSFNKEATGRESELVFTPHCDIISHLSTCQQFDRRFGAIWGGRFLYQGCIRPPIIISLELEGLGAGLTLLDSIQACSCCSNFLCDSRNSLTRVPSAISAGSLLKRSKKPSYDIPM